ncbi:MAG: GH3 auxin-responsive promoter family protein [Bacteroidales bacterium]|nr:GH3 auxin-responsive promoter family protein [Bacteroidales bacterium]
MPLMGVIIKKAIEFRSKIPKDIKRVDGFSAQTKVLRKLLRKAQFTYFGEHYNFFDLLKQDDLIKTFKENVPIHDYNAIFSNWWYRSLNGEAYITWPGRIKYFALSSGTSEASSKYIPVTSDMLRAIKKISIRQLLSMVNYDFPPNFFDKGVLMLGGSTHLHYNGTYYEGDLSGISASNIPFWFQHFYKPGKRISKERDWTTKLDEIVKSAPNWDIGIIVGVPAWLQILLKKIIDHHHLNTIHDIWPNLSIYVHGGVSFDPYVNSFEKLLAHPLTYMETYLASEGFIAYQSRPNTHSMELVLDNGIFYEFVPFNEENFDNEGNILATPSTLTIDEVKEHEEYALLLSTNAGAWRYLIGDTIKFTSIDLKEIVITGRTKHFLNLCGEHLSQENMNRAIKMLEDNFNIGIDEFSVTGIKYGSMFAHKWYLGTNDPINPKVARNKIDEYLKVLNDDYRVERIAAIKDVIVEIYPADVFYDWMKLCGKEGGQNKFPRILKNEPLKKWEEYLSNLQDQGN